LDFTTTVVNSDSAPFALPANLTERFFRRCWDRSDKAGGNERQRFQHVLRLMQEHTALMLSKRPKIGPDIIKRFADGKLNSLHQPVA
jgi:hypothetical protein